MGLFRKIKNNIPVGRGYLDRKIKDQETEIQKLFERQSALENELLREIKDRFPQLEKKIKNNILDESKKIISNQDKNMKELGKSLVSVKQHVSKELTRRDEWAKCEAETLRKAEGRPVWVIKCPAPDAPIKVRWGDYPFAMSLKKSLEALNLYVIVDTRDDWNCEAGADVVIVLRGLYFYRPDRRNRKCVYIMWNISHPDMVTAEEYQLYDIVCVGSKYYAKILQEKLNVPVFPLLQCTDTTIFYPPEEEPQHFERDYIFIGNSRGIARSCVMWAIEDRLPLQMWGGGWDGILRDHTDLMVDQFIDNSDIPELYRNAKVTLNDHWQDMLEKQFVNNRIFDALACGLPVISDTCEELREIFPEAVLHYETREEFEECIKRIETDYERVRAKVREQWPLIQREYSFEARARQLLELAKKYGSRENRDEKAGCL